MSEPVETIPTDPIPSTPEEGTALCLSGGGYRAMVFHVGVLWRLYEAGLLAGIDRISSVSGGSITAAVLGLKWDKLSFDAGKVRNDFVPHVVEPLRALASETIDADAIVFGSLLPGRISDRIARAYEDMLFRRARRLQDLPDKPRFVINATNVQSGALWRFSKPYMRDYRVGKINSPTLSLAQAVAASSAFPPVLSPVELRLDPDMFEPGSGHDLQRPAVHQPRHPFRWRRLRQSRAGDRVEALPDDPGQRRRRPDAAGRGAEIRLGAALLPGP